MSINGISPAFNSNLNNVRNLKKHSNPIKTNVEPENKNEKQLEYSEVLGRSQVNFQGHLPFIDKLDAAFLDNISKELKLTKQHAEEIRQSIINCLKENNLKSMADIGEGEEYEHVQTSIMGFITKDLKLSERESDFVASEIISRSSSGEDYIPHTMKQFRKAFDPFEDLIREAIQKRPDRKFVNTLATTFDLNRKDALELESIIEDVLEEHNYKSLKDLKEVEDFNAMGHIVESITERFNLSDRDSDLIVFEMENWITNCGGKYIPGISRLERNAEAFNHICKNIGIDSDIQDQLYQSMLKDAQVNGYSNIFESVKNNPDLINSSIGKIIYGIEDSEKRSNLILDFIEHADQKKLDSLNLPKHLATDTFYCKLQDEYLADLFQKKFGFSKEELKDIKTILTTRHSKLIEGGCETDIWKIAFDISDKYDLPSGSEKKIVKMIQETDSIDRRKLDAYCIQKLQSLNS